MDLKPFTGPGATKTRRAFWDQAFHAVMGCRKIAGRNVDVSEHDGLGTLINVNRTRSQTPTGGACPTQSSAIITFSGITTSCGCIDLSELIENESMQYIANPFNDTFTATAFFGTGWVFYDIFVVNGEFYEMWTADTGCSGTSNGQDESGFDINIACFDETNDQGVDPGKYIAIYAGPSFQTLSFYAAVALGSGWSGISNTAVCGEILTDSFITWNGGDRLGSATGGTASVAFS